MSGPFRNPDDPADDVEFEEFRTWLSDRVCPACGVPLYSGRRRKVALDACGSCGGVWVDDQNAHHLLESKDPAFAIIASAAAEGSEKRSLPRGVRRCPDCREPLREGYLSVGRVNVDVCSSHGTFFDPWELNAFVEGLAKGTPKPHAPGPYDRPLEMETPFVALLRRVRDEIRAAVARR